MTPTAILIVMLAVPVVAITVLRINAALVFLSLCLGDVLVQFVARDAGDVFGFLANNRVTLQPLSVNQQLLSLSLLLGPALLTAIFMIRTVRGRSKLLLNLLPAAGASLLGVLLSVPLLSRGLRGGILTSPVWQQVNKAQDLIVGLSALGCLMVLWIQRPKAGGDGEGRGHKK